MKSILIGLVLTLWIQSFPGYTQRNDSTYCTTLGNARALVADALRLRVSDSLNNTLAQRVTLLESQVISQNHSFTNLLKIEQEKYIIEQEKTTEVWKVAYSFRDQMNASRKKERRVRWQRNGLGALLVAAVVGIIAK